MGSPQELKPINVDVPMPAVKEPKKDKPKWQERIASAAVRHRDTGERMIGVRHHCPMMRAQMKINGGLEHWKGKCDQGFVTNKYTVDGNGDMDGYRFVDRFEAWKIAEAAGQIFRQVGNGPGELYSENLH